MSEVIIGDGYPANHSKQDNINPSHYTSFKIAPNEYITANELEWEVGNCCKYISRYDKKNGLEDLLKAAKYLSLLIERKYGEKYNFVKE